MKALLNKGWIILIALFVGIASCGKDNTTKPDTTTPVVKTKTQILTQKGGKITKVEKRTSTTAAWTDITSTESTCDLNETWMFRVGGTVEVTPTGTTCGSKRTLNWSFDSNTPPTKITIDGIVYNLDELTEQKMVISTATSRVTLTFS